jgi:hypothetical protein
MTVASSNRTLATNRDTETITRRFVDKEIFHIGEPTAFPLVTLLGGYQYEDKSKPKEVAGKIRKETAPQVKDEIIA